MRINKKLIFINLLVFFGILSFLEGSLRVAKYFKDQFKFLSQDTITDYGKVKVNPTKWDQVFHPGVGHSHQFSEFERNKNTSSLKFDNISATEIFATAINPSQEFRILILGSSSTDILGTQFTGFRGTWVHYLFDKLSLKNQSRYIVDNAANGGSTSSNDLLRLITKFHEHNYDLTISFNGINEYYFLDNPYFKNKENVLASSMLLKSMGDYGIIKSFKNKTYVSSPLNRISISSLLNKSILYTYLQNLNRKISEAIEENNDDKKFLTMYEKEMLTYGANVWEKNIDFMYYISASRNSNYLAVLQPALGLSQNYCKNKNKECMLTDQKYIMKINFIYSLLQERCAKRSYCLDISSDTLLTSDESLYIDPRHINIYGSERSADLIENKVNQLLEK